MGNKREEYQRRFPYNYEGRKAQQARIRGLNRLMDRDKDRNFYPVPVPDLGFRMTIPSGERKMGRAYDESVDSYIRRLRASGESKKADAVERRSGRKSA